MIPVRKWQWVVLTAVLAAPLVGGITIWKGSQALRVSRQELQADREFEFTLGQYAPPQNMRFEPVRSPEVFARVAHFRDHLYVAGPAVLAEYDSSGGFLPEFPTRFYPPLSPPVPTAVAPLPDFTPP